jgi:hypothetical protein
VSSADPKALEVSPVAQERAQSATCSTRRWLEELSSVKLLLMSSYHRARNLANRTLVRTLGKNLDQAQRQLPHPDQTAGKTIGGRSYGPSLLVL